MRNLITQNDKLSYTNPDFYDKLNYASTLISALFMEKLYSAKVF